MARAKRYTCKELQKRLEQHGWTLTKGGKHVVRMSKPPARPITIPRAKGATLSVNLTRSILKQAGIEDD